MSKLSIIIPCYNEQEALPLFFKEIDKVICEIKDKYNLNAECIFVDDGSKDNTLLLLKEQNAKKSEYHYVSFSRNFGKESALYAGLKEASGDYVTVMDADLQDPPELLLEMIEILNGGEYDCVGTRRTTRKGEPPIRSFFAKKFYQIINKSSDTEIVDGARDFRLMTRQMVDAILEMSEYNRFSKGIFSWVGFRTKWLEYENVERAAGQTKWNFWSLSKYAIDGIVAFTVSPLHFAAWLGIILFLLSIIGIIFIVVRTIVFGDPTSGWPSMVSIILFVSGIQLFCTGIIGEYLSKTYLEVKGRPVYIVREKK